MGDRKIRNGGWGRKDILPTPELTGVDVPDEVGFLVAGSPEAKSEEEGHGKVGIRGV